LLHHSGLLKRLINGTLSDVLTGWLLGESLFSHIQTLMSEMLSVLSNFLRIGRGTPSGLCCQPRSTATMSPAVPAPIPNQSGLGLSMRRCAWTHQNVIFISRMHSAGGVILASLYISLKVCPREDICQSIWPFVVLNGLAGGANASSWVWGGPRAVVVPLPPGILCGAVAPRTGGLG
jgi:hypothetical protein